MARFQVNSVLDAPPETVWDHLNRPELLAYLAHPLVSFRPLDPPVFPEYWEEREYTVALRGFGWLPLGRQVIGIERPPPEGDRRILRDRGRSLFFKHWHHTLSVEPAPGGKTRYTDDVDFDAGILTPVLVPVMRAFFARRHRRWAKLAGNNFDYAAF